MKGGYAAGQNQQIQREDSVQTVTMLRSGSRFEIMVDPGACRTEMPMSVCHSISALASRQYMEGVEYEVANGESIPNLGSGDASW